MLVGRKTKIVALEPEHLAAANRWVNDPRINRFLSLYMPAAAEDTRKWYDSMLGDDRHHVFAILTKKDLHIGNIGLHEIDWKNSNAEIGIALGDLKYLGRGYGEDAVRTVSRFAFDELGLHRLHLKVFSFNPRAIACYEKCGFKRDGILREAEFSGGMFHDVLLMSQLADESRKMEKRCEKK